MADRETVALRLVSRRRRLCPGLGVGKLIIDRVVGALQQNSTIFVEHRPPRWFGVRAA